MNNDYVLREEAISAAIEGADEWDGGQNITRDTCICDAISALAPADVRPVVRGEWVMIVDSIFNGERFVEWSCSECRYVRNRGWSYTNDGKAPDAKFCENCGADMREVKTDV